MKIQTYSIRVTGKVQGVYYRASTRVKASDLGVKGWVRNEPDGTVSILAQGEESDIQSLIKWCRTGPPGAVVDRVEFDKLSEKQIFETFSIRR